VPALVLIVGLPAEMSVGTAFVFAGVLRLIAAPFYLAGRHVHWRYLWLLVLGAVPGLLVGTYVLKLLSRTAGSPVVVILLGVLLTASSSITFIPRAQKRDFAAKNSHWLPWLALPIGVEAGFSSAGAGALGTVLLLNYSEMTPPEVVGTDIFFGLVLAVLGSAFHWKFGSINSHVLTQLLEGGVPAVVAGSFFARRVPARKLKLAIALIAIFAGLQLVWSGSRSFVKQSSRLVTPAYTIPAVALGLTLATAAIAKITLLRRSSRAAAEPRGTAPRFTTPAAPVGRALSSNFCLFPSSMACCSRS